MRFPRIPILALTLAAGWPCAQAQSIARVQPTDAQLDCAGIAAERKTLADTIAAGDPNAPSLARTAAGGAANMGGQVAGAVIAQGGGLFGSLVSKVAGAVAKQQVEERMGPDAEAQKRAAEARERTGFLDTLAAARQCRSDDPSFAGNPLSPEAFGKLADGSAAPAVLAPLSAAAVSPALDGALSPLPATGLLEGNLETAGRPFHVSEFRVLFEVGGTVSANTRAGHLPGVNYGATRSTIRYEVANPDIAALQAIVDRAWRDFNERAAAAGVKLDDPVAVAAQHGEVYPATEPASAPGAPVYAEINLGHVKRKYLVLAPTGMKLHSRGLAGLGAGDIGKRIEWTRANREAIAVGIALNVASLETSGSGSSILRSGSSTRAGEGMTLAAPAGAAVANGHVRAGMLRLAKELPIPGAFARFRETGGYDTQKDAAVRSVQILGALAGVAPNASKTVEMAVDLDGPATARMALAGLATFNEGLVGMLKAGQ